MEKTLERKLRKLYRKHQWRNRWLGFEENGYKLVNSLPLNAYEELERDLTDEEFYEIKCTFEAVGKEKILFAIFPSNVWIKRCCSDSNVLDTLSNSQLEEILDNVDDVDNIFDLFWGVRENAQRQCRLMSLLNEGMLEKFIREAGGTDFPAINEFLVWLCEKEQKATEIAEQEKIADIFRKISSISDSAIANLLVNTQGSVAKRITEQVMQMKPDVLPIYKEIKTEKLYDVLSKSEFVLLERADSELYSWLYANLPETDKVEFLEYLVGNLEKIELFDAEICAGIFALDNYHKIGWKTIFVMEVFSSRSTEEFNAFYEKLSPTQKEEMFDKILLTEKGEEVVKACLNEKNNLSLLESLLNEKYVTN